jgi:dTDP-4-dehydrorhamnose reductase
MKLLIIGSGGQLGYDFVNQAEMAGHVVVPADYPQIDIRARSSAGAYIDSVKPDAIVNCAAFTAVDNCESERDSAFALNAEACGNLAEAAKRVSAMLIHFSTDYVFDGLGSAPYTEDSPPNPQSVYGKSKLAGEEAIVGIYDNNMIFRIAWLYGSHGNNFVKTIRRIAAAAALEGRPLKVVNDQFGTPTWTVDVCQQVLAALGGSERGIFHCTSEGFCSWFDFAAEIAASAGIDVSIEPCATEEFPRPAPRPRYSVLENARLKSCGIHIMPDWRSGFGKFLASEEQLAGMTG